MKTLYHTRLNSFQLCANFFLCSLHIKTGLNVHPELRGLSKIFAEPKSYFTGYGAGTVNDVANPHRRYPDVMRKFCLRDVEFVYNLFKYHAGMHRLKISSHFTPLFLVIIRNFNIISTIYIKSKADAPLVIDADTPLTFTLARKSLKAVRGWKPQVLSRYGSIQLSQFNECPRLNVSWQLLGFQALKQLFGFLAGKRPYHEQSINKLFTKCQMAGGAR